MNMRVILFDNVLYNSIDINKWWRFIVLPAVCCARRVCPGITRLGIAAAGNSS